MKLALLVVLSVSLPAWAATIVPIPFSQEPRAVTINTNDDVIVNVTNAGTGTWTTKRATVGVVADTLRPLLGGSGTSTTNLANLATNGLLGTNDYSRLLSSSLFHQEANRTVPMGIMCQSYGSNYFTYANVIGMARFLNTNHLVEHGYNIVMPNCGFLSATRSAAGDWRLGPTGSEINVTNLVADLLTNGCYLGLYFQTRTPDNALDECYSMTTGPTNAYRDGYAFGKWGVRAAWNGDLATIGDDDQFRYISQEFHAGLYDGATAAGWPFIPNTMISVGSYRPIPRWCPEVWNHLYSRAYFGGDMNTVDAKGYQAAFFYSMRTYNWTLTAGSSPSLFGFVVRNTGLGSAWVTPDSLRFIFGMDCMNSMVLYIAGASATADELAVITNDAAIAICQDGLRAPPFVVSSNATSAVITKQLLNGDVAVALWNLDTNSATTISVPLASIPGIHSNQVSLVDVFDRTVTGATNTLSATVNTSGLNLYRLTPGQLIQVDSATDAHVLVTDGTSTNQALSNPTLLGGMVAADVVYQPVGPTNPVTTNLVIWLKADAQGLQDGTATNWLDSSGLGNDATNTASWPIFHTNMINGLPAFQFTNAAYLVSKYAGGPAYSDYAVIAVLRQTDGATESIIVDKGYDVGFSLEYNPSSGGDARLTDHYITINTPAVSIGSWTTAGGWKQGTNSGVWYGASTNGSGTFGTSTLSTRHPSIGGIAGSFSFNGFIAEVLFYEGGLSYADLSTLMNDYIRPKYFAAWPVRGVPITASPVASQSWVQTMFSVTNGLPQLPWIPTNSIPPSENLLTNYVLMNLSNTVAGTVGGPCFVATNHSAAGSFIILKPSLTQTTWP